MSADALKTKLDQYLRPENFEGLRTPKVNPAIWNQISAFMRTQMLASKRTKVRLWVLQLRQISYEEICGG